MCKKLPHGSFLLSLVFPNFWLHLFATGKDEFVYRTVPKIASFFVTFFDVKKVKGENSKSCLKKEEKPTGKYFKIQYKK